MVKSIVCLFSILILFMNAKIEAQSLTQLNLTKNTDFEETTINSQKNNSNTSVFMMDCPFIGNKDTQIYHQPGQAHYNMMRKVNKCVLDESCQDNRICFDSKSEAESAGYVASQAFLKTK